MDRQALRRARLRPERKPPQLFKVPFYEEAVRLFRQECPMEVSLELEATTIHGQDAWAVSAFSGPRSFAGLTVNHMIPRNEYNLPTRDDVMCAVACLAETSRSVWAQRLRREKAKADLAGAGQIIGKIVHVD
jgi:hypothetical protein